MSNEVINELFYSLKNQLAAHTTQFEPTWEEIATIQAQAFMRQQAYNFEEVHYFNNNTGHFFQPHNNMPSYNHSGWRTYEDFSYGDPSIQS